jgi:hypothetical protein
VIALAVEISLVVAWFVWAYRRQLRERARKRRGPDEQLPLPLDEEHVPKDRQVGS